MAPSEVSGASDPSSTSSRPTKESQPTSNGNKSEVSAQPATEATSTAKTNAQRGDGNVKAKGEKSAPAKENKEDRAAAAEQKKKAKAEKQARRAQKIAENTTTQAAPEKLAERPRRSSQGANSTREQSFSPEASKSTAINGLKPKAGQKARIVNAPVNQPKPSSSSDDVKKVALFQHLYVTDTQLALVAKGKKDVHPAVLALGLQMRNYVICGSSARCVAMLLVFKRIIESYVTPPGISLSHHLIRYLSPQIEYLRYCRPLSVSMSNAIRWLKVEQISNVDPDTPDSEATVSLATAIDNFIRDRITVADQVIATSAAGKIVDGDVLLTYAKSNIVQQILFEAYTRGTKFRVVVVDSRPLFEGKHMAQALAERGIEVQYSLINGISHAIKDVTKVFLGAHAMLSNGRLFSRVGTAIVAMTAHSVDVPVIVCCESVKFSEKVTLDSIMMNEVAPPEELVAEGCEGLKCWKETAGLQLLNILFDVTPAEYVKMVITEYGSLPPSSVPVVFG